MFQIEDIRSSIDKIDENVVEVKKLYSVILSAPTSDQSKMCTYNACSWKTHICSIWTLLPSQTSGCTQWTKSFPVQTLATVVLSSLQSVSLRDLCLVSWKMCCGADLWWWDLTWGGLRSEGSYVCLTNNVGIWKGNVNTVWTCCTWLLYCFCRTSRNTRWPWGSH